MNRTDPPGRWITGVVVKGHQVASRPSEVYPYGTLEKQKPYFQERGLDLSQYFTGTLNISLAPRRFAMIKPEYTFLHVAWTEFHPPETFSFSRCRVRFDGREGEGIVYYPHPETKIRHQQVPSVIEIITEYIPGIGYGDRIEIQLNPAEIEITR